MLSVKNLTAVILFQITASSALAGTEIGPGAGPGVQLDDAKVETCTCDCFVFPPNQPQPTCRSKSLTFQGKCFPDMKDITVKDCVWQVGEGVKIPEHVCDVGFTIEKD